MSYASVQNLKDRLGYSGDASNPAIYDQLTDPVTLKTADDGYAQTLIDNAQSIMDGWFARRYATPIDTTGDADLARVLREHCLNIAQHHAWTKSPLRKSIPRSTQEAHDETIDWLKAVAEGDADIPADEIPEESPTQGFSGKAVGEDRVSTSDAMDGLW